MMKKMFGVGGTEGVHAFPPTKKAFESLFNTYNDITRLLELSAYTSEEDGRTRRHSFPVSKMNDRLTELKEKFIKEKRHYVDLQRFDIERDVDVRTLVFMPVLALKSSTLGAVWCLVPPAIPLLGNQLTLDPR